jgi:GxxExxY protein
MRKTNDELNALSRQILDTCFYIHNTYGPGMLESFYEAVLCYELGKLGLTHQRQLGITVLHDGQEMGLGFRMDVLVENEIIVELKSKEKMVEADHKQLITHLKTANKRLGLLVNFGEVHLKDGIHRKVNGF